MADKSQYRRKQDGHIIGPFTKTEMKAIAGYAEEEWEEHNPASALTAPAEVAPSNVRKPGRKRKTAETPNSTDGADEGEAGTETQTEE